MFCSIDHPWFALRGEPRSGGELAAGREASRPEMGARVGSTVPQPVDMPMETGAGPERGNVRVQAGSRLQPVVEGMAGNAAALLIEVIGEVANVLFAWFWKGGRARRLGLHRYCGHRRGSGDPAVLALTSVGCNPTGGLWGVTLAGAGPAHEYSPSGEDAIGRKKSGRTRVRFRKRVRRTPELSAWRA